MPLINKWIQNHWRLALLVLLPLCITLINPNWIYNPDALNNIDTWVYTGLFHDFFNFAGKHPSNVHYFVERLSWVLPGYFLYHVFGAILGNAILHLSVFYACVFSMYGIVQRLFDKDSAFITALCLGSYTWFLRAAGHDYVDGAGIAYFSVALWFITESAYRLRYKVFLLGGGVFLALALLTQLFLGVFIPVLGIYYLTLNWQQRRHPIMLSIIWGANGVVLPIMGFMIFNLVTVGEINIFNDSLSFVTTRSLAHSAELYKVILRDYIPTPPTWLVLPCIVSAWGIICLIRWNTLAHSLKFLFKTVLCFFILTMGIFIYFHYRSPYLLFVMYLYMSLTIPAIFLFLGGLVATTKPVLTIRQGIILWGITLIPFLMTISFSGLEEILRQPLHVWLLTGLAIIILCITVIWRTKLIIIVAMFSVMSLLFSGHNGLAVYDRLHTYRIFMSSVDILALVDAQDPKPLDFSEYIVWEDTQVFSHYSKPIRGMSQPVHGHAPNWGTSTERRLIVRLSYQPEQKVLLLSENEGVLDDIQKELSVDFIIEIHHSFDILSVDPTGQYRGYLLLLRRIR